MNRRNIGILGATEIANRVLIGPSRGMDEIFIYGIAARDPERARTYAKKYEIPHAFADYEALLNSDQVDIVYIPLVNTLHSFWIAKAAEMRKHILVEKPICLNSEEIDHIRSAAEKYGSKIVEGLMVQHHPWLTKIREIIATNIYGKLLSISTELAYPFTDEFLSSYVPKGGGVFIQDSVYWLHLTQVCFGLDPVSLTGRSGFSGPNGIDTEFKARMDFPWGAYSYFSGSFKKPFQTQHTLQFESAEIKVKNFIKPAFGKYRLSCSIRKAQGDKWEKLTFEAQSYFQNQMEFLLNIIDNGNHEVHLNQSFERVALMERIYKAAKAARNGKHLS